MARWQAELALDARANLGEGPVWDARTNELLWVDIMAGLVHRFDPLTGTDVSVDVGQPVGAVVPRAAGGYALAVRDGFAVADTHLDDVRLVAPVDRIAWHLSASIAVDVSAFLIENVPPNPQHSVASGSSMSSRSRTARSSRSGAVPTFVTRSE